MSDDLLTTTQAAERLGLSRGRVQVLIRTGRLAAKRVGRDWILSAADVDDFALLPRQDGYPTGRPRKAQE